MDTKEKRITRILKRKNGNEIEADEMLKDKYVRVFGNNYLERVEVIDIQTAYNDYKKLHDDLHELAQDWGQKIICFSSSTDILDILKMKDIRKACRKKRISAEQSMLNISIIGACFLTLSNIFYITWSFIFGEIYPLPAEIVLPALCICLSLTLVSVVQQTRKHDSELLEKLGCLDENGLIDIFSCLEHAKSPLKDEGIFFIENFNKLNKLCRSYMIAYLRHKEYKKQIWCVFDYLFENSLKIDSVDDSVFYEAFKLVPLKYEEKEAFYKEYNLQRDIAKEYLNCIGVDILWGSKADIIDGSFKFHSLDYIKQKIESTRKEYDPDGKLIRIFYCLVYLSSKYKYSFSVNQIISLIQNEEKVNQDLYAVICDAGNRVFNSSSKSREEIRDYISKMVNLLEEYCFTEYGREGGRKVKKVKFSYDILECFHEKMSSSYPDEETVKRWVLVKLIGNINMFQMDRYFFDCSNLLVTSDFLDDKEFCILSSYLLRIMNASNCWTYNSPVLKRLHFIDEDTRKQYLHTEAVKKAAGNCLFYISDDESMRYGIYFMAGVEGCSVDLDDFTFDNNMIWMPEMEKYSNVLAGYFKLLYKTFGAVILAFFEIGSTYRNIFVEPFSEQENLFEIIRELLLHCISYFNRNFVPEIFNEDIDRISQKLSKIRLCTEANEFASIVEEILLWIKSELNQSQDRAYRNIYTGMLIETSNSNMLYFIYGLLNMLFAKDRETVYKNKNSLLDFISQSVFYFKIVCYAEGITQYVDTLLQGRSSIELKLIIAINLLIKKVPCREIIRKFIIENLDKAEDLFLSGLDSQNEEQLEKYIALLLLYDRNISCAEFTEKIFVRVYNYISTSECVDGNKISKYLRVILEKKCPAEETLDIIDEINRIASPDFAIWTLYGYFEARKDILERIPQINPDILTQCSSNLGTIMMSDYLLNHSYYDCNREILELYLEMMRYAAYPNKGDTIKYLGIIDKYAQDNVNIKYSEIRTYNYLLSLYLFYMAAELSEQKETDVILLQETMKFMLNLFTTMQMAGMKIVADNNKSFCSLVSENKNLIRKQEADRLIKDKFLYLTPVIYMKGQKCLSEDYYYMLLYMSSFPDVCMPLIKQAEKNCMEIIKQKHMLYLVNVLLDHTQNTSLGFDRKSLYRIRDILIKRYNIKY